MTSFIKSTYSYQDLHIETLMQKQSQREKLSAVKTNNAEILRTQLLHSTQIQTGPLSTQQPPKWKQGCTHLQSQHFS
jgi:hypothetical protein